MKILGITRDKQFSPNMEMKDQAIMNAVASELRFLKNDVELVDESAFGNSCMDNQLRDCNLVFTMMRSENALRELEQLEKANVKSVNPSKGIRNAERKQITRIMSDCNVPVPQTFYNVSEDDLNKMSFPYWMKRGEGWAQTYDDVVFVRDLNESKKAFDNFIKHYPNGTIMMTSHQVGDLVKFYGVEGTDFFFWYYPIDKTSKFGLEMINGKPMNVPFNEQKLKKVCNNIAEKSMIYIYGGDCIVDEDGDFVKELQLLPGRFTTVKC